MPIVLQGRTPCVKSQLTEAALGEATPSSFVGSAGQGSLPEALANCSSAAAAIPRFVAACAFASTAVLVRKRVSVATMAITTKSSKAKTKIPPAPRSPRMSVRTGREPGLVDDREERRPGHDVVEMRRAGHVR